GHHLLAQGHRTRPEARLGPPQPGPCATEKGQAGRGHCLLQEGHRVIEQPLEERPMREQSPWWLAGALLALLVLGCEDDTKREVEAALKEAEAHQKASRFCEARIALARAEGRLGKDGPKALRQRFEQMRKDIELVARLEAARLSQANVKDGAFDR